VRNKSLWLATLLLPILFGTSNIQAQSFSADLLEELRAHGEAHVMVSLMDQEQLTKLSGFTSVVTVRSDSVLLNVNFQELLQLAREGYSYAHAPMPRFSDEELMGQPGQKSSSWTYYPTWFQYDSIMHGFALQYPTLCKTSNFLTLNSGRKLLISKITSPVSPSGGKPKFLYTSTMHGNETAGYILMLRLMDHLLQGYGTDPEATWILDNIELWICPLANPDGTYYGGNHTVAGAIRRNANLVDLNRNYPDPRVGANPDGNPYQPETVAFMGLADTVPFVMGANLHSGAEVVNYPWDTWIKTHPDDSWWHFVSRRYADTVHANAYPGFFMDLDSGVTNGAAWYVITGGRQDYMNYFAACRELTLEVSASFIEPVGNLNNMWSYHHRSMINYLKQGWYGLRGTVTDSVTGQPLRARVWINQHDADSSHVWSNTQTGHFYRPLAQGSHSITWSAPGYVPKTLTIAVPFNDTVVVNIPLVPIGYRIKTPDAQLAQTFWYDHANRSLMFLSQPIPEGIICVYSLDGREQQCIKNPRMQQPLLLNPGIWMMVYSLPDGTKSTRKVAVP